MSSIGRPAIAIVLLSVSLSAILDARSARAQVVTIDTRRARAGASFDGAWRESGLTSTSDFRQTGLEEWFELPVSGRLLPARAFSYDVVIRPTLRQNSSNATPNGFRSRALNIDGTARFSPTRSFSVVAQANRRTGTVTGGFGTRSTVQTTTLAPMIRFHSPAITLTASYIVNQSDNRTEVGPSAIVVHNVFDSRTARFIARSSKLDAIAERTSFADGPTSNNYESTSLRLSHWMRWGRGSELRSMFDRVERTGTLDYTRSSLSERLRLQHGKYTFTTLSYNRFSAETRTGDSRGYSGNWEMNTTAIAGLGITGRGSLGSVSVESATIKNASVGGSITASREIGRSIRVSGRLALEYASRRQQIGEMVLVSVISESHRIDATRSVVLDQLGVLPESVVVQNAAQTVVYAIGIDYEVVGIGRSVHINLAAGSRINEGDQIVVDYQYRALADDSHDGLNTGIGATLRYKNLFLNYTRSLRSASGFSAPAPVIEDFETSLTSVSCRQAFGSTRFNLDASHRTRSSDTFSYRATEARLSADVAAAQQVRVQFDLIGRLISEGETDAKVIAVSASTTWQTSPRLRFIARSQYQRWFSSVISSDELVTGGLVVDYRVGAATFRGQIFVDRRTGTRDSFGQRAAASYVRRF